MVDFSLTDENRLVADSVRAFALTRLDEAGLAAIAPAVAGGAITGIVLGIAQWLGLRRTGTALVRLDSGLVSVAPWRCTAVAG